MERIEITYCQPCGYQPKAVELANRILNSYGTLLNKKFLVTLKPADNGIFDVSFNDKLIFSRYKERRMPEVKEILEAIEASLKSITTTASALKQ